MYETFVKASNFVFINDKLYCYRASRAGSIMNTNTFDDRFPLYDTLKQLHTGYEFQNYIKEFYKYISIDFATKLENSEMSFKQMYQYFCKFRNSFYDENYSIDYSNLKIGKKIRLFVFKFCLKYKLNYFIIGKLHNRFNPIRIFTRKNYY